MDAGAWLVPAPADHEGLDEAICRGRRARVVHATPSHRSRLGLTMNTVQRMQLLSRATRNAWIIGMTTTANTARERPIVSLPDLDTDERVIYVAPAGDPAIHHGCSG